MDLNFTSYKLFAGAGWNFSETLHHYPPSDYSLKIILKLETGTAITLTGSADWDNFNFSKPSSETTLLVNGDYDYQVIATSLTDANDITVIAGGRVHVYPLLTSSVDQRSRWQKRLEALEAAYDNWCDNEANEVDVNGKKVVYRDPAKLVHDISIARIWVKREEEDESGLGTNNDLKIIFRR